MTPSASSFHVARLSLLFLLPLAINSCTSLQWQSADGTQHEVGLVIYSVEEKGAAVRLHRVSFGATLRLSGPDPGYTLGIYDAELIVPEFSSHGTSADLAESVAKYLAEGDLESPARTRCGFLWFSHPQAARAIAFRTRQAGIGFALHEGGGFMAGIEDRSQLVGPVLRQDAVQLLVRDLEHPAYWAARAWTLDELSPMKPR